MLTDMAPYIEEKEISLAENSKPLPPQTAPREYTIVYSVVLIFVYWHIGALYGLYLGFTSAKWATIIFNYVIYVTGGFAITAGAHRLWSHRAFKATLPLQLLLMLLQTMSCQKSVLNWVRDHRLHHKYCDTDADPYNSTRGIFYSHVGWLLVKKHPEVIRKGRTIDMSDLENNPVLKFQKKYYLILVTLMAFILPALIPVIFWQESLNIAHHVSLVHLVVGSHMTFAINSIAHAFGTKPYDKTISPTQSLSLSLVTFGEGYHNYHHVFPFDYRVAELGNNYLNLTTNFIDFFAWIGWAYDLKYASPDMVAKRVKRTGDGTDLWGRVIEDADTYSGQ
ncbi:acyl-CoA Delta(11) desaturase-like isoform X1 [Cydia pomonella]|uniref:acyl-CoA Delta(11) desaturase-like isoform X1 n=2 Tax=Cydia pomonella TaxID=82600 RepID=UPI002ADDC0C3|nr:acyl-CoA Delta(11) desaturase-like isoform X1 [Cydia pomonella]